MSIRTLSAAFLVLVCPGLLQAQNAQQIGNHTGIRNHGAAPFEDSETANGTSNSRPVCVPPMDMTITRQGDTTTIFLDGSNSFDPDGDPLLYRWFSCPGSTLSDPFSPTTFLTIPTPADQETICGVRLSVRDGQLGNLCRLFVRVLPNNCLVIIDEDTIDNGISTIEAAAAALGVEDAYLVNDDRPTEVGNPPLRWNELAPGSVVLLPSGQVDDEGWFALPEDAPFSAQDFALGLVPQDQLDPIPDVMPLRNQELFRLLGQRCTAVVYDSDISMNYEPIQGNLQGARYGLFTFTVLDVLVPGSIPESQSDTDLYDLLLRVEPIEIPDVFYTVPIFDHEPDAVEITSAFYSERTGILTVVAESDFEDDAFMTCSLEGMFLEQPMTYIGGKSHQISVAIPANPVGLRVTCSTDRGGAYTIIIE